MPLLRKMNQKGIEALQQFISEVVVDANKPVPTSILTDPATSEALQVQLTVDEKQFTSRMQAAEYLHGILAKPEASGLDREPGVWAWLSLLYFDQLCPKDKAGKRNPKAIARWIPSGHAFRYYRHLLAGPYLIYKAFRDGPARAAIVLCGPLHSPGDIVEQLASRQEFVQNKAVIEAATKLYLNPLSGKPKRGAADTKHRPGTLRRYVDVINQLDPTWDLHSMTADQLLAKLPKEFDGYKGPISTAAAP